MDDFIQILQIIAGFIGPIIVVWFTAKMNKITKDNAEIKRLEDEKSAREKQELNDTIENLSKKIESLESTMAESREVIRDLTGVDNRFDERVVALVEQQKLLGQYVHKLAQLVITVATGMRDQHLDGNITRAVDDYREFEQRTLSSLMTKDV